MNLWAMRLNDTIIAQFILAVAVVNCSMLTIFYSSIHILIANFFSNYLEYFENKTFLNWVCIIFNNK